MQIISRALAGLICLVALAACSPNERGYFREGIGSQLYSTDVADETSLQNLYIRNICAQTGLNGGGTCDPDQFDSRAWMTFVQAGMNDIDRRCDAYLVWLDERRRSREPILQEISDVRTMTAAILTATGAGVEPMAIAAAAFGLASASFTNLNSSLILELDQSTVQAVVLGHQNQFRESLPAVIDNRPAAVFALRSYMRLCMPMTIDTQVNTTMRLYVQGSRLNVAALQDAKAHPLVDARIVKTVTSPVIASANAPAAPIRVPAPIAQPGEERVGLLEQNLHRARILRLEAGACVADPRQLGLWTHDVRQKILDFLEANGIKDPTVANAVSPRDAMMLESGGAKC